MPELPEVETIVRGLRACLTGRRIEEVAVSQVSILKSRAAQFVRALEGAAVKEVRRFGKHILLLMERGDGTRFWWMVHLGMTGQFTCGPSSAEMRPHTHAWFELEGGRESLRYTDIRRFGRMRIAALRADGAVPPQLARLGPDPLEIPEEEFVRRLRSRKARVKALLLDQRFLRGLGNIYADESLFRAGIHPAALGKGITQRRAGDLWRAMRLVLEEAIEHGGSSISDYVDAGGRAGAFQDYHRVYGRAGQPCLKCGRVLRRAIIAGRGTTWCPRCQRKR